MTRREGPDAIPLDGGVTAGNEPVPSASLTIVDVINGGNALLFTDEFLTTPASNPVTCDGAGRFAVYVHPGTYSFTVPSGADAMENVTIGALASANAGGAKKATAILSSSPTGGVGYATGAGGTVTQITNRSTGVTLNKVTGKVQTDTTSLAAGASATFTVTNSAVAISDAVLLSIRSGQTNKETRASVTAVAAGSFDITIMNNHASTAEVGAIVINFAVVKGVVA